MRLSRLLGHVFLEFFFVLPVEEGEWLYILQQKIIFLC